MHVYAQDWALSFFFYTANEIIRKIKFMLQISL